MKKEINQKEALNKAANLCSRMEKCKSDIRIKLVEWGLNKSMFDEVINSLEDDGFIDEERYTEYYVKEKVKFNHWGRIKIRAQLQSKQISETIIKEALNQIDEEQYVETLKDILSKKNNLLNEEDFHKKKAKLIRFASGKGYESELILKILDSFV